jgi:hypothetical protein
MNKYTYRRDDEPRFIKHASRACEFLLALCVLLAILHHVI